MSLDESRIDLWLSIGPVSRPTSIFMIVTPVSSSPCRMAALIGAALARRAAIDYYRRRRPALPLEEAALASDPYGVEDTAQEHADFAQLVALLARLADRERELVALKYGAGLTNRDIARLSGLSESNVSTILSRVTQQLRAQWKDEP